MLARYGKDSSVTAMVDRMDWVIMPVLNVDGYEYSHTKVSQSSTIYTSQTFHFIRSGRTEKTGSCRCKWKAKVHSSRVRVFDFHLSPMFSMPKGLEIIFHHRL